MYANPALQKTYESKQIEKFVEHTMARINKTIAGLREIEEGEEIAFVPKIHKQDEVLQGIYVAIVFSQPESFKIKAEILAEGKKSFFKDVIFSSWKDERHLLQDSLIEAIKEVI